YVSPDFRDHVVGRNLKPLFICHSRSEFEIVCYSGVVRPDELTKEIFSYSDRWRSIVGLSDNAVANMIYQDGIDILVDLSQHMAGNRLRVFTLHPAPVQVSFAGYPETTGVSSIKYRISDRHLSPQPIADCERAFLIDSFWCYD